MKNTPWKLELSDELTRTVALTALRTGIHRDKILNDCIRTYCQDKLKKCPKFTSVIGAVRRFCKIYGVRFSLSLVTDCGFVWCVMMHQENARHTAPSAIIPSPKVARAVKSWQKACV